MPNTLSTAAPTNTAAIHDAQASSSHSSNSQSFELTHENLASINEAHDDGSQSSGRLSNASSQSSLQEATNEKRLFACVYPLVEQPESGEEKSSNEDSNINFDDTIQAHEIERWLTEAVQNTSDESKNDVADVLSEVPLSPQAPRIPRSSQQAPAAPQAQQIQREPQDCPEQAIQGAKKMREGAASFCRSIFDNSSEIASNFRAEIDNFDENGIRSKQICIGATVTNSIAFSLTGVAYLLSGLAEISCMGVKAVKDNYCD